MLEWAFTGQVLNGGVKRLLVGRPLRSDRLGETLLPKRLALPVFACDPLSSVAYATQEILLVLTLGGLALLYLAPWVAAAVVVLLAVVVVSYRQVVHAYPSGGGSYEVASRNLGRSAGLVVGRRAAGRLRDDGGGVGGRRRGQHHLRACRPSTRTAVADRRRLRRAAHRDEPARDPGVRAGLRRPDLPVHRRRARS